MLLLLPLFWNLRLESGQRLVSRLVSFLARTWVIFLLALPLGLIEAFLMMDSTGVWNRFVWPFILFYGFLLACDRRFVEVIQRHRMSTHLLGIVAFHIYFVSTAYLLIVLEVDPSTNYSPAGLLARFFKGLGSWFWIIAIMGFAGYISQRRARQDQVSSEKSGNPGSPPLEALSRPSWRDNLADFRREAQLPFYVLHQLPIILMGYFVVQWQVNILVKYVVIILSSIVATLMTNELAVRRTPPARFLFGLKPRKT